MKQQYVLNTFAAEAIAVGTDEKSAPDGDGGCKEWKPSGFTQCMMMSGQVKTKAWVYRRDAQSFKMIHDVLNFRPLKLAAVLQ